jgi:thioredoxin 1
VDARALFLDDPQARPILITYGIQCRGIRMGSSLNVKDNDFETQVLKAEGPVMVDFWAEWCGPCKAMSPVVDEVASELGAQIKVVKVNIDDSPNAPTKYNVRGIPTFMVFKGGEVVGTRVGGMSKSQLSDWLKSVI